MLKQIIERLIKMDKLIHERQTGTPEELAVKLGVSSRTVYESVQLLRQLGAPLLYSRSRKTYYYTQEKWCFKIGCWFSERPNWLEPSIHNFDSAPKFAER